MGPWARKQVTRISCTCAGLLTLYWLYLAVAVLDTEKKKVISNLQKEVASVSRQLLVSRENNERMKVENNVQLW